MMKIYINIYSVGYVQWASRQLNLNCFFFHFVKVWRALPQLSNSQGMSLGYLRVLIWVPWRLWFLGALESLFLLLEAPPLQFLRRNCQKAKALNFLRTMTTRIDFPGGGTPLYGLYYWDVRWTGYGFWPLCREQGV